MSELRSNICLLFPSSPKLLWLLLPVSEHGHLQGAYIQINVNPLVMYLIGNNTVDMYLFQGFMWGIVTVYDDYCGIYVAVVCDSMQSVVLL